MLVIYCVALLPVLASCYPTTGTTDPNVATDESQPALQCAEDKLEELNDYWKQQFGSFYTWLDSNSNAAGSSGPYMHSAETEAEEGCDSYDANKDNEKYGCFPRNFFCAAKKVVKNTDAAHRHLKSYVYHTQSWRHHFDVPDNYHEKGNWAPPLTDDIRWAVKMRWQDPKLQFLMKTENHEQLTEGMLARMFHFIKTNNIDEVANLFHRYKEYGTEDVMKEQCESKDRTPLTLPCKIVIVFDGIDGLIRDNEAIGWDGNSSPPRTREELAILYLLQPKLFEIMEMSSESKQETLTFRLKTMFRSFYDNTLQKNTQGFKNHFGYFGNIRAIMLHVCSATYNNDLDELPCYLSETFKRLHELQISLGHNYDQWETSESRSRNVVVLLWLLLTPKATEYFEPSATDLTVSLKHLLEIFYHKIQEKGLVSLRYIVNMLPPKSAIGLDSEVVCRPSFEVTTTNTKCAYTIMMENVIMFLDEFQSKGGKKVKKLDMSVDYRYRLEQFKISSIHGAVQNTKLELQSSLHEFSREIKGYFEASIGNRFKHLRDYFTNVASFDKEIAEADTAFITTKLNEFYATAVYIQRELEFDAKYLQAEAMVASGLDAIFMWAKAAARIGLGIFGALGGDFGGIVDAVDAVDAAMEATKNAVVTKAVIDQIKMATDTYNQIYNDLLRNRKQLENTREVIKKLDAKEYDDVEFMKIRDDFIKSYNDYTPMVTEAQIAKLDAAWSAIVDNLDNQLNAMQTSAGIAVTIQLFAENHVFKIQTLAPQLEATLSARFDYQFDLMDSLAATMRAHNSMQAAKRLTEGFSELEKQQAESLEIEFALEHMALSTYIISQFHLLLTLGQYCHYITYMDIGVQPIACRKALATLTNAHIDEALSYQPPPCDMITVNARIPTSETGEPQSINIRQLNSGAQLLFQIPDFDWLMRNADIAPEDKNNGLYVKMFELYVITNSSYKFDDPLRVEVSVSGPASILNTPDELQYELCPRSRAKYVFEYKENYGNCEEEINPYHVCTPGPKGICVQSRGEMENTINVYPSIYSPWRIQLNKAIEHAPKPENTTKLFLQAKLKLCRKTLDSDKIDNFGSADVSGSGVADPDSGVDSGQRVRHHRSLPDSHSSSCPPGKYFDQKSGQFENCGANATPQHYGYYCGKA